MSEIDRLDEMTKLLQEIRDLLVSINNKMDKS